MKEDGLLEHLGDHQLSVEGHVAAAAALAAAMLGVREASPFLGACYGMTFLLLLRECSRFPVKRLECCHLGPSGSTSQGILDGTLEILIALNLGSSMDGESSCFHPDCP